MCETVVCETLWHPRPTRTVWVDHICALVAPRQITEGVLKRADFLAQICYTDATYDVVSGSARRSRWNWTLQFCPRPVVLHGCEYVPPALLEAEVYRAVRHSVFVQLRYGGNQ